MHRNIGILGALAVFLLAPVLASAQPLADRIPGDALIYVGWKGSDSLGSAYEGSHLKGVMDASNLPEFINDALPRLAEKIAEQNQEAGMVVSTVMSIGGPLWRHTSALYVGPIDLAAQPMPHAALLCDAGKDAPALAAQIRQLLAQAGPMPIPLEVKEYNGLVAVLLGTVDPAFEKMLQAGAAQDPAAPSLANTLHFKESMKQVNADPVFINYIDDEAILRLADGVTNMMGDPNVKAQWTHIRDALGLGHLKRIIGTSGFDGKDWSTQAFVEAPAPRPGALSIMVPKPLTDDALRAIPKTATFASAARFSLAQAVSQLIELFKEMTPESAAEIDGGIGIINHALGMDFQKDILGSLGDEWAFYSDPTIGGNGLTGFVAVNHLSDPAKTEKALTDLETVINNLSRQNADKEVTIAVRQSKIGELTLHYLNIPLISPAWTIKDGNLYVAVYPQMCQAAAKYVADKGPSILDNPDFVALRTRLGGQKAIGITFMDLPKSLPNAYGQWVAISRLVAFSDVFGVQTPPLLIPPLPRLLPHLSPAGSVSWIDDAGWHMRAVSPFPGSELLSNEGLAPAVGASSLMISILLPSLNKAREAANQIKSAANLKQIGMGCILYSDEGVNAGKLPPDLGSLLDEGLTPMIFISPSSNTALPPGLVKREDQAVWVNEHSDYVYLGAGKTNVMPGEDVLAYEKLNIHRGLGANVLFGDGHVQWLPVPEVQRLLEKQKAEAKP